MKNEGIQSLRGIAALAVVLHHVEVMVGKEKYFDDTFLGGIFLNGFRGVDLFFVISGFIMMNTIQLDPDKTASRFLWQRAKRIFVPYLPVFFALSLASIVVPGMADGGGGSDPYYLFANLLLLPRSDLSTYVPVVAWTLTFEMTFYIIFAVALLRRGTSFVVVLSAWMLACFANLWVGLDYMVLDPLNFGFGIGILSFVAASKLSNKQRPLLFVVSLLVLLALLAIPAGRQDSLLLDISVLLASGGLCASASFLKRNPLSAVGDWSYSLYLVHYPVIAFVFILAFRLGLALEMGTYLLVAAAVAASLIASYIYYRLVEVWLYRRIR